MCQDCRPAVKIDCRHKVCNEKTYSVHRTWWLIYEYLALKGNKSERLLINFVCYGQFVLHLVYLCPKSGIKHVEW